MRCELKINTQYMNYHDVNAFNKYHVLEKVRDSLALSVCASSALVSMAFPMIVKIRIVVKSERIIKADKAKQMICTEDIINIQHSTTTHDINDANTIKIPPVDVSKIIPIVFLIVLRARERLLIICEMTAMRDNAIRRVTTTVTINTIGTKGVSKRVNIIVNTIRKVMSIIMPFRIYVAMLMIYI